MEREQTVIAAVMSLGCAETHAQTHQIIADMTTSKATLTPNESWNPCASFIRGRFALYTRSQCHSSASINVSSCTHYCSEEQHTTLMATTPHFDSMVVEVSTTRGNGVE